MSTAVSLTQMVDLALGTPELGAVNFNVLHTLLHAVIQKLNIADHTAPVNEADREFLSAATPTPRKDADPDSQSEVDSAVGTAPGTTPSSAKGSKSATSYPVPYHALAQKVSQLQERLESLNDLPSNNELFERARGDGEKPRPVSDMWQNLQLTKKVDTNEEGINKLMSLVEDMMGEMQQIRDENDKLKKQLQEAIDEAAKAGKFADGFDDLLKRLKDLENKTNELNDKFGQYPDPSTFNDYVTWTGLEDALRGLKENMDNLQNQSPPERVVIEMSIQTDPMSRPSSSKSRSSTPGPSAHLQEILEKLGSLSNQHDTLEQRVDVVEEELKNKVDKGALDGLGVPEDLLNQLKDLTEQLEALKKGREKDSDALTRMQQAILQLQTELERISNMTTQLVDDTGTNKKDIENLFGICNKLDEAKADKEFVQSEVEVKADKRHLDGKVNRSLFDTTCDELNKMISDILNKLIGHEDEWKKALSLLSDDLDGKLDRLEFGPIRDELERQLKLLLKKLNNIHFDSTLDDDAAGIRKQLMQKFHCISCDRPVEMGPNGPIPSIPAPNALPATRSSRPYTTFELDTIRQHAKSIYKYPYVPNPQTQIDIMDLYATQRACGGNHTLTYPNRRMTKLAQMNTLFRDEELPPTKEELDIQGADGHVYKGQKGDKLPNLPQTLSPNTSRKSNKNPHPPAGGQAAPNSAISGRPRSAQGVRNTTGTSGSRPASSAGIREIPATEVPTGRISTPPPPPAPAPSEPDPMDIQGSPSAQPPLITESMA